jgi:non-specific serine/threonine protein kinase
MASGEKTVMSNSGSTPPRSGTAPLTPGTVLKDRFVLESIVTGGDKGGMGVVFKALDRIKQQAQDRNPYVAIKLLREDFRQHPDSMIALQREARRAQTLAHPNIITVYDFDRDGDTFFMAMELLQGRSLDEVIRANREGGGLPVREALGIIEQLARALAYAHAHHIVHSDFKPSNAFLTTEGVVKVLDFGIARAVKQPDEEMTRFDAGSLGAMTLPYASCEQLERQDPDPSDDIYALAIVSYELLSGRHPFERTDPNDPTRRIRTDAVAARSAQLKPTPAPLPGLTRQQWDTVRRGLAFRRADRPRDASEFLAGMTASRRPVKALLVAAIAIVALLVTSGMLINSFLHKTRLQSLTQRLQSGDPKIIDTALHELQNYPADERASVLLSDGVETSLLNFCIARAREQFNPDTGHYDYPGAMATLKAAQALGRAYEDSRQLNEAIDHLQSDRQTAIAHAADAFESQLQQGLLIPSQGAQNVRSTLALIRGLDPNHPLLNDRRLPIAYASQARTNLDAGHAGVASALLAAGLQVAPTDPELLDLQDRITRQQSASQPSAKADQNVVATRPQTDPAQLRAAIAAQLDTPLSSDAQVNQLQHDLQALQALVGDRDAGLAEARTRAAQNFLTQSQQMLQAQRFSESQHDLDLARQFNLAADAYQAQASAISQARQQREADDRARQSAAELTAAKQRVLDQARADHIDVAQAQFAQLQRSLPAGDAFLTTDGPQALANAYLVRARRAAAQARFDDGVQQAQAAEAAAPDLPQFDQTLKRFQSARELAHQFATLDDFASLRPQLDSLRDAERVDGSHALQTGLTRIVAERLAALRLRDPGQAERLRAMAVPMFPSLARETASATASTSANPPAAAAPVESAPAPAPTPAAPATPAPAPVPVPTPTSPATVTPAPAPSASAKPPAGTSATTTSAAARAAASAPVVACGSVGAGVATGVACRDDLGKSGRGPEMMVIPASLGLGAYAVMRNEASIADYNLYCARVSGCTPASGDNPGLPVSSVSEAEAEKYAAWLSSTSGAQYRIPTDREWKHAAGAAWDGDANCLTSAHPANGSALRAADAGLPNELGLRNVDGNVQEWVKPSTGGLKALGGAIGDPIAICQTEFSRPHSGQPDGRTGFRLVREIR